MDGKPCIPRHSIIKASAIVRRPSEKERLAFSRVFLAMNRKDPDAIASGSFYDKRGRHFRVPFQSPVNGKFR